MNRAALQTILDLPADKRVELAQQIWESVVEHPELVALPAAQRDELERRWSEFQENPAEGEPWEDVRAALLKD